MAVQNSFSLTICYLTRLLASLTAEPDLLAMLLLSFARVAARRFVKSCRFATGSIARLT